MPFFPLSRCQTSVSGDSFYQPLSSTQTKCRCNVCRDLDVAQGNIHHTSFRGAAFDAIVTDPPYGRRISIESGPQEGAESFQGVLRSLLRLASSALVPGGRLSCWLPLMDSWLTHEPQGVCTPTEMHTVHVLGYSLHS